MTRRRKKKKPVSEQAADVRKAAAPRAVPAREERRSLPARRIARPPERKITWRAAEFHYFEKDYLWYAWVIFAGVLLFAFALWQRSFFFAVFVVIATVLVVEFGKRRPRILDYELNEKEVLIDKKMSVPYRSIESFHIRKRLGLLDEIVFKRDARVNPFIHLPIDDELAIEAREFLLEYIPEDEHEHTFIDILAERIGF